MYIVVIYRAMYESCVVFLKKHRVNLERKDSTSYLCAISRYTCVLYENKYRRCLWYKLLNL